MNPVIRTEQVVVDGVALRYRWDGPPAGQVVVLSNMPPSETWADRAAAVRSAGTAHLVDGLLERWFTAGFPSRRPDVAALVTGMVSAALADHLVGRPAEP